MFALHSAFTAFDPIGFCFSLIMGLLIGSFLNVIIHRVPKSVLSDDAALQASAFPILSCLVRPASTTPCCHVAIAWYDNIPLISWLILRGKCRACGAPIRIRYLLVEISSAATFALVFLMFGQSLTTVWYCLFFAILIALFWIDLETYLLPDCLTLTLLWLALIGSAVEVLPWTANEAIIGACIAYAGMWSVDGLYYLWRRRHGFGGGDFKLLAALGAWLGMSGIIPVLLIASILAILTMSLFGLLKKEALSLEKVLPFGPFLVLAACIVFLMENFLL